MVRRRGDVKTLSNKNRRKMAKKICSQIYDYKDNAKKKGRRRSADDEMAVNIW